MAAPEGATSAGSTLLYYPLLYNIIPYYFRMISILFPYLNMCPPIIISLLFPYSVSVSVSQALETNPIT